MPGRLALDTSAVIPYRAGEEAVVKLVTESSEVFVPVVVVGELIFGAIKSPRVESNVAWIENFIDRVTVLEVDVETARIYGETRDRLRQAGAPIPENDRRIAAAAIRHNLTLAARDKHFASIPRLSVHSL